MIVHSPKNIRPRDRAFGKGVKNLNEGRFLIDSAWYSYLNLRGNLYKKKKTRELDLLNKRNILGRLIALYLKIKMTAPETKRVIDLRQRIEALVYANLAAVDKINGTSEAL